MKTLGNYRIDSGNTAAACQSWVLSQALRGGNCTSLNKGKWLARVIGQPSERSHKKKGVSGALFGHELNAEDRGGVHDRHEAGDGIVRRTRGGREVAYDTHEVGDGESYEDMPC